MGRGAGCPVSPDDANDITITLGVVIGPRMAPITVLTVVASNLINNTTNQLTNLRVRCGFLHQERYVHLTRPRQLTLDEITAAQLVRTGGPPLP